MANKTIDFLNTKDSKIRVSCLDDFDRYLTTLYDQVNYACNCYYISDRLYVNLTNKYSHLENKWYLYALNSLEDNVILLLIKLYNDQGKYVSLYNILNYFSIDNNFNKFINTPDKKSEFEEIVNNYNKNYADSREKLIIRRNNWHVHISTSFFEHDASKSNTLLTLKECFDLLYYALHTLRKLYRILFNKNLPLTNHSSTFKEIDRFILQLNENGDLK